MIDYPLRGIDNPRLSVEVLNLPRQESSQLRHDQQDPALLRWALTSPLDRVMYTPLSPYKPDFEFIVNMMIETGVLEKKIAFEEFVDTRFAEAAKGQVTWSYAPSASRAE